MDREETMTTFIYMNHRIRDKVPAGPVIVADTGRKQREANCFDIISDGKVVATVEFNPKRNPSKTHEVRAYVQTQCKVVARG